MRRLLIGVLLVFAAGCSEPPQKEIDQAQSAIDAARAAGADKYAADEYNGATETLQKARTSVDQRDYRQALSYAIDARQRAAEAANAVVEAKAKEKRDAEQAVEVEFARLTRLETLLHEAEAARPPAQQLHAARAAVDAARAPLQEARSLVAAANYPDAATALTAARAQIDRAVTEIDALPQHGRTAKRRR